MKWQITNAPIFDGYPRLVDYEPQQQTPGPFWSIMFALVVIAVLLLDLIVRKH
jgi:hypothetical protein